VDRLARQHHDRRASLIAIVPLADSHFAAIADVHDDYAKAGFPMLPVIDPADAARRQAVVHACAHPRERDPHIGERAAPSI
jgi:heme O synthase-like polyprenyltransferase